MWPDYTSEVIQTTNPTVAATKPTRTYWRICVQ